MKENHLFLKVTILFIFLFLFSATSLALIPGDFGSADNGPPDGVVDFEDLMIFALAYGSIPADTNWNPDCDIAGPGSTTPDGIIDFEDLMIFALHYGEEVQAIIPETTEIINEETTGILVSVSEDQSTMVLSTSTTQTDRIDPGDIIVMGITDQTPYGLLRRVTSINRGLTKESQVILDTEFATLEEAIQKGHWEYNQILKPEDIEKGFVYPEGIRPVRGKASTTLDFEYEINVILYDQDDNPATTEDNIMATGYLAFNYQVIFDGDIDWHTLKYFIFKNIIQAESELDVSVGASVSVADLADVEDVIIGKPIPFTPVKVLIPTPIGIPIPLVFYPSIELKAGIEGEAHILLEAGIRQTASYTAGIEFTDGDWQNITTSPQIDYYEDPIEINGGIHIIAHAGPQLNCKLYNVAGPYCKIFGYLNFEADTTLDPWWDLDAMLKVLAGVKLDIYSVHWGSGELELINLSRDIIDAGGPFGGDVADISGNWSGEYSTNLTSGIMNLIEMEQNGETFNGKYGDTNGAIGNFNGKFINKDSFEFIIEQTNTCGDSGNFQGTGMINNNTISINFSGNNWEGYHENGIAILSIAVIKSTPVTGVRAESTTGLSTTNDILNGVEPSWDSYPDALGYEIYRSVNGEIFELSYILEPCNGIIDMMNIDTNNEYCYYVIAFGNGWRTIPSQQTNVVDSWLPVVFLQNPENGADVNIISPTFTWSFNHSQIPTYICSVNLIFSIYEDEVSAGAKCYYKTIEDETISSYQYDGFCLLNGHKYLWNIHAKGYNDNGIWYDNVIADSCSNRYEFTYVGSLVEPPPAIIEPIINISPLTNYFNLITWYTY